MKKKQFLEKVAIENIVTILFSDEEWDYKRLNSLRRKYLKTKFQREVFLASLTRFQVNIVGKDAKRLQEIYIGLSLHRRSLNKLNSTSWNVAVRGIIELAEMNMKEYIPMIRKFINNKNTVLRLQAQIALIQLEDVNPFDFLNELKKPLLDWEQLELAHVSEQLDHETLPDFKTWLDNDEDSIVIFCLRMIALHNQVNASETILNMLHKPDISPKVLGAVIFTIRQLDLQESADYLRYLFPHNDINIQQEIINTLSLFNQEEPDKILDSVLKEEKLLMEQFYKDTTVFIPERERLVMKSA